MPKNNENENQDSHASVYRLQGNEKQKGMIRVLRTSENEIILDATGKKNGRGAYLCFSEECLEKAIKNHGLERSLKMAVPDEVYQNLKKEFGSIEKQ